MYLQAWSEAISRCIILSSMLRFTRIELRCIRHFNYLVRGTPSFLRRTRSRSHRLIWLFFPQPSSCCDHPARKYMRMQERFCSVRKGRCILLPAHLSLEASNTSIARLAEYCVNYVILLYPLIGAPFGLTGILIFVIDGPQRCEFRRKDRDRRFTSNDNFAMFKKPFTPATVNPLRTSDNRKLLDEASSSFAIPLEILKQLISNNGKLTTQNARTHLDEPVTIYSDSTTNNPLLFRVAKGPILPTIYLLDLFEFNLPSLVTAPEVLEHLISGRFIFILYLLLFPWPSTTTDGFYATYSGSNLFSKGVSPRSLEALPPSTPAGSLCTITACTITAYGEPQIEAIGTLAESRESLINDRSNVAIVTVR
jgi:hypothetical protein